MNDVQQEHECLKSVLRAVKAYRDAPCSETLMNTLQDRVIEQRQRYDKLVHARTSKEHELEAAVASLKSFREESAGRMPDKSSQRKLRVARNTFAKAQTKLGEAQSIEQMYRALLLQLRNDHDVARKDLADMDLACDRADRDMVQQQQQLKQRRSDHATALDQYHSLVKELGAAKQQAHLDILNIQDGILHHHGQQTPCTLEVALADANACKIRLGSIAQRVRADDAALAHQEHSSDDPGHGQAQTIRTDATTSEVLREPEMEVLCLSASMDQPTPLCTSSSPETAQILPDGDDQDTILKEAGHTAMGNAQDEVLGSAMADLTVVPTADMTKSQIIAAGSSSVASGVGKNHAAESSLVEADFISTRAVSTSGTEESIAEIMPDGGQGHGSSDAGSETVSCDRHVIQAARDGAPAKDISLPAGPPAHQDCGNNAVTEEDLLVAWEAVLRCMPSVQHLGHRCDGRQAGEVLQTAAVVAEAQEEMMAVLQQWLASGEAELARRQEGAMVVIAE